MTERETRWLILCIALVIVVITVGCTIAYVVHPDQWCNAMQGSTDCLDKSNK